MKKSVILLLVILMIVLNKLNDVYEYNHSITCYTICYRNHHKVYTCDVKGFYKDEKYYFSLNDFYQIVRIYDQDTEVYHDQKAKQLFYKMSEANYVFDYHNRIMKGDFQDNDVREYVNDIYFYNKNVYLSICFIEKTLLKDELKIKVINKNAIIK